MGNDDTMLNQVGVIAELANAHEGDRSKAISMIKNISDTADTVKIQAFTADDLAVPSHNDYDLYKRLSLSEKAITSIADVAQKKDLQLFADVLGPEGLDRVTNTSVDGFKIHSSDITNHQLIKKVGQQEKPTIISAGGVTSVEIRDAISSFQETSGASIGLVYGFQNYPTKLEDAHLNRLRDLVDEFGSDYPIGYASHVDGGTEVATRLPAWSVAAGADFVEIHLTLDRSSQGIDYYSSLEPHKFEKMAENIYTMNMVLGDSNRGMSRTEQKYRSNHKKSVVATKELTKGNKINVNDTTLKRTQEESDSALTDLNDAVGMRLKSNIDKNCVINNTDIDHKVAATLACRAESTRLYGKPLQLLGDSPILSHQITQLRRIDAIDEILLAIADTPSKSAFIQFAKENNLQYIIGSEENVLNRILTAGELVDADILVRSMTENPYLYEDVIPKQIETAIKENADLVVPRKLPLGTFVEIVSTQALRKSNKYGEEKHRSELVTSFITDNPNSFRIVGIEPPRPLQRPDVRMTVDNPCDLILVRKLWQNISKSKNSYDLNQILKEYDTGDYSSINDDKIDGKNLDVVENSWHIYGDVQKGMNVMKFEEV